MVFDVRDERAWTTHDVKAYLSKPRTYPKGFFRSVFRWDSKYDWERAEAAAINALGRHQMHIAHDSRITRYGEARRLAEIDMIEAEPAIFVPNHLSRPELWPRWVDKELLTSGRSPYATGTHPEKVYSIYQAFIIYAWQKSKARLRDSEAAGDQPNPRPRRPYNRRLPSDDASDDIYEVSVSPEPNGDAIDNDATTEAAPTTLNHQGQTMERQVALDRHAPVAQMVPNDDSREASVTPSLRKSSWGTPRTRESSFAPAPQMQQRTPLAAPIARQPLEACFLSVGVVSWHRDVMRINAANLSVRAILDDTGCARWDKVRQALGLLASRSLFYFRQGHVWQVFDEHDFEGVLVRLHYDMDTSIAPNAIPMFVAAQKDHVENIPEEYRNVQTQLEQVLIVDMMDRETTAARQLTNVFN